MVHWHRIASAPFYATLCTCRRGEENNINDFACLVLLLYAAQSTVTLDLHHMCLRPAVHFTGRVEPFLT